jgi:hypothetical protein
MKMFAERDNAMTEVTSLRQGKLTLGNPAVLELANVRVEVSADGKEVTAYTNEGVQPKKVAATADAPEAGTQVAFRDDGSVHVEASTAFAKATSVPLPDFSTDELDKALNALASLEMSEKIFQSFVPASKPAVAQETVQVERKPETVSLPENTTSVTLNGVTIEQALEGHLVITAPSTTNVFAALPEKALEAGQLTENGVFVAVSTDKDGTKRAWFADLADAQYNSGARLSADFNQRAAYAAQLNTENHLGHNDWVVAPSHSGNYKEASFDVLSAMYNNRAAIGGFDEAAQYASSSRVHASRSAGAYMHTVDFKNGNGSAVEETARLPFRLVRSVKL